MKKRRLLEKFIRGYAFLRGPQFITYNIHNLINSPYFVLKHGPLESFSAFRYKHFLKELIISVQFTKYPLQEIRIRIFEKCNSFNVNTSY